MKAIIVLGIILLLAISVIFLWKGFIIYALIIGVCAIALTTFALIKL